MDHDVDQVGVVPQPLLHQAGQGGEHQGPVETLFVHQLQAGGGLPEGGDGERIGSPKISRRLLPSGLPWRK